MSIKLRSTYSHQRRNGELITGKAIAKKPAPQGGDFVQLEYVSSNGKKATLWARPSQLAAA